MTDRQYIEITARLERLEQSRLKDIQLKQALFDQQERLLEQQEKMMQILLSLQSADTSACHPTDEKKQGNQLKPENWLDNQDLCELLHVSPRSLQRYRSEGLLPYKMMHKKAYYTKEGVMKFLDSHVVNYNCEEITLYFAKLGKT